MATTHETGGGAGGADVDDFDLSAEDHSQDNAADQDSPDRTAVDNDDDNSASNDDDADPNADSDKTPVLDPDLDDWAEKTGRGKPETDRERKLMQDIRNGQRDFSKSRTPKKNAAELNKVIVEATPASKDKSDDGSDPLEAKYDKLERDLNTERTTRLQSEYFSENKVTDEEVTVMGEILKEKADRGDMKAFEYLSDARNLDDLHDLVKIRMSKDAPADGTDVVAKAKEEERQRLAKITKSGGPSKSARSTTPAAKKDELAALWESDD